MSNHSAEANLPISPLAQWMRDTTGRPDDGSTGGLDVYEVVRRGVLSEHAPSVSEGTRFAPPPRETPGTLTVNDVLSIAAIDPRRLEQAADDAIAAYIAEGHSHDEIKEHERRIWALHDQILGETV